MPSPERTSDNVNGERSVVRAIKEDPVLNESLTSFGNKRDIDEEIRTSSKTLGYGSNSSAEVFHCSTVAPQYKVIAKANTYVEVIITKNCKFKVQGIRGTAAGSPRNYVQAYLSELTLQEVKVLLKEVHGALEDVMDTNKLIKTYSSEGNVNSSSNDVIGRCFNKKLVNDPTKVQAFTPKGPYKPTDDNRGLHQRLAIHNRHFIPIGYIMSNVLKSCTFILTLAVERRIHEAVAHHLQATRPGHQNVRKQQGQRTSLL